MTTPPLTARASASVVVAATVGRASPQRGDLQVTSAPVAVGGPPCASRSPRPCA